MSCYQFEVMRIDGRVCPMATYRGKVLLIVNMASQSKYTPQLRALQALYERYQSDGLEILAFPCDQFSSKEPASAATLASFCDLNYGIRFTIHSSIQLKGPQAHPLFRYLMTQAPGLWGMKSIRNDFTKFLVDRQGEVFRRYKPSMSPEFLEVDIRRLLNLKA